MLHCQPQEVNLSKVIMKVSLSKIDSHDLFRLNDQGQQQLDEHLQHVNASNVRRYRERHNAAADKGLVLKEMVPAQGPTSTRTSTRTRWQTFANIGLIKNNVFDY